MMSAHFPRLFEPIRIGAKVARNRVTRLATTTNTPAEFAAFLRAEVEKWVKVVREAGIHID